jgi:hypothetical protein
MIGANHVSIPRDCLRHGPRVNHFFQNRPVLARSALRVAFRSSERAFGASLKAKRIGGGEIKKPAKRCRTGCCLKSRMGKVTD